MKNLLKHISLYLLLGNILLFFAPAKAEVKFSGDVTGVSAYVWRGIKQFDGFAFQGTAGASYKSLSFGVWYSSVNFGPDTPFMETDPFIELSLPTGILSSSIGLTAYSYDFKTYNDQADYEYELFGKVGLGASGLAFYYVPGQKSTQADLQQSAYWIVASTGASARGIDWGLLYEFGTYSSRFLATPIKGAVGEFIVSASKTLGNALTVGWSYSIPTSSQLDNNLYVSVGFSF